VRPQRFACRPAPPPSTNSLTRRDRNRQWPRLGSGRPTPLRTSASPQTPPVLLDSGAGFKKFISGFHTSSPPPVTGTPSRPCCAKSRRPALYFLKVYELGRGPLGGSPKVGSSPYDIADRMRSVDLTAVSRPRPPKTIFGSSLAGRRPPETRHPRTRALPQESRGRRSPTATTKTHPRL